MQVILMEKIASLGQLGDIVNVKRGFARNYLIPQGKAKWATESAIADFSEALSRNHQFAGAYYCRGFAKEKLGDFSGARDDYRRALKLDPEKPVPALMKTS